MGWRFIRNGPFLCCSFIIIIEMKLRKIVIVNKLDKKYKKLKKVIF